MGLSEIIIRISIMLLPMLFAITLHEYAHGRVALIFGDNTAKMHGRLTINPIKHIDIIGTVVLPLVTLFMSHYSFMFGWAKPVPINPQNFQNNKFKLIAVAMAGPFSNLVMMFLWALIAKIGIITHITNHYFNVSVFLKNVGAYGVFINAVFLIVNILPIPPLDGATIWLAFLKTELKQKIMKNYTNFFWIALMCIFFLGQNIIFIPAWKLNQIILQLVSII